VLVIQFSVQQWDKGQCSEAELHSRTAMQRVQPINQNSAFYLFEKRCVIDQHGDDRMGNRLIYQRVNEHEALIDRFHVNFEAQTVSFKGIKQAKLVQTTWACEKGITYQTDYQWRYRVDEGGYFYWLYEHVVVNFAWVEQIDVDVFTSSTRRKLSLMEGE
jgi:hypothetical protein